jgi:hypothetical protein
MKRYIWNSTMLLTLLFVMRALAQNEEPQLEEYFPNPVQRTRVANARRASLDRAFYAMYDLDFTKADSELARYSIERPNDPLGPAAQAASALFCIFERYKVLQLELFISDDRYARRKTVVPDKSSLQRFESALDLSEKLAKQVLANNQSERGALFALALVYGLRADYSTLIEHRDFAALRFSDTGNDWARKLLAVSPQSYDAYVAIGIQKYLVSLKPAPIRWMLRLGGIKGNQDEGIHELELATGKGHYLAPFARILLAVAHLRKQEREEAFTLLVGLREQFPHNSLVVEEMAKLQQQMSSAAQQQTSAAPTQSREKGQ